MYVRAISSDREKQTLGPSPSCVTPKGGVLFSWLEGFNACSLCSPPTCATPSAGQSLAPQPLPDDAEQQAALLLACSGDTLPASLPPVNMYDLFEALQVSCSRNTVVSQHCPEYQLPVSDLAYMHGGGFDFSSYSLFPSFPLKFTILWLWLVPTIR